LDLCSLKTNRGLESRRAWNALTSGEIRSRILVLVTMKPFDNILFPVDFSLPCTAIAPYVKRIAEMFGARVTLAHVFDLGSSGGLELYVRPLPEVLADHHTAARNQLSAFLVQEFPMAEHSRIVLSGDVATRLIELARTRGFDLIIMPTHAGTFVVRSLVRQRRRC
jgi:nucleotide-binding universal stress UspA family protein